MLNKNTTKHFSYAKYAPPLPPKKKINFDRDILESRRYAYVYYVFKSFKSNKVCESKQKKPQNEVIKLIISPTFFNK